MIKIINLMIVLATFCSIAYCASGCPAGCYYHPAFDKCFSSYSPPIRCYKIEGCYKSSLYGACEEIFTPESQGNCRAGYIDDSQLKSSVRERLNKCLLEESRKKYIQDSIRKFKMDSTIMYRDSIRAYKDSIADFEWKRDSIAEYKSCYEKILVLSRKIKEKEKVFKEYFSKTFNRDTRCDYIENFYKREIQNQLDSIKAYKDSIKAYKDSIAEYNKWYKELHAHDFRKKSQTKIGGITVKKVHQRYGSDEWVHFYIFNDVEGDGDTFEIIHDNECETEDDWDWEKCHLNDDYIDPEVPIFYQGEHIATVNIDYYSQKKLSWSSICHIDNSRINDIKACVRKYK